MRKGPHKNGSAEGALLQASVARTEAKAAVDRGDAKAAKELTKIATTAERNADILLGRGQITI
jgi:hypothetical protein